VQVFAKKTTATRATALARPSILGRASFRQSRDFSQFPIDAGVGETVQGKLWVNTTEDAYGQEADRGSEQVLGMPEPSLLRACPCGGGCPQCQVKGPDHELRRLQTKLAHASETGQIAIPPIVHEVLRSPGQPLPSDTRAFMEPRFGRDFSRVRVHNDERAAESARAVNAAAYTVGRNVVFGAGQYRPGTVTGRQLLSHELTHVLQQERSVPRRIQRSPSAVPSKDGRATVLSIIDTFQWFAEGYHDLLASENPVISLAAFENQLCDWLGSLHTALGIIRTELKDDPDLTKQLRLAYATVIEVAVAAASKAQTIASKAAGEQQQITSHGLYQIYRDLIYEWAWPLAKDDPVANKLSATLSVADPKTLIVTTETNFSLQEFFKMALPMPKGVAVKLDSPKPAKVQMGLINIASKLARNAKANCTVTLVLDLELYGGDYGAYRFTYIQHVVKGVSIKEVLIEHLGSVGLEELPPSQMELAQKKFENNGFKQGSGFSDQEFAKLLEAIMPIPDSVLFPVKGITFQRRSKYIEPATAPGSIPNPEEHVTLASYNVSDHMITIYDAAFDPSMIQFGTPGSGMSTSLSSTILHEIGHAVDLAPLRTGSSLAHTASGSRLELDSVTDTLKFIENPTDISNEFQQAASKDGLRLTDYSKKSWAEYFAEAFALYIEDPGTLYRLRPSVFEYFSIKYPTTTALRIKTPKATK